MILFSPPHIDDKTIAEVVDTLKSGWITTGPKTKLFEKRLASFIGCKSVLAVGSATAGLELMLRWFGVGEGDEVILPAYTYCATANVVLHCGAKVVMVDVNARDFNINIDAIRKAVTPRTKVIIPVDLGGYPCDYHEILELVKEKEITAMFHARTEMQRRLGRILILADTAHSFGAVYHGRKSGSVADVSVFSFHAVKNLTTAEGGAVAFNLPEPLFDNEALYKESCITSLHGQSKDALAKTKIGGWRYDVLYAGYKCNMTDIQASIGLVELERYESEILPYRKRIFKQYDQGFKDCSWAELPLYEENEKCTSYHVYCLRIKGVDETQRDAIIQGIFEEGVAVNVHFQPLPLLTVYRNLGYEIKDYPQSYLNYSREISLPVWYGLDSEKVEQVIAAVKKSVARLGLK